MATYKVRDKETGKIYTIRDKETDGNRPVNFGRPFRAFMGIPSEDISTVAPYMPAHSLNILNTANVGSEEISKGLMNILQPILNRFPNKPALSPGQSLSNLKTNLVSGITSPANIPVSFGQFAGERMPPRRTAEGIASIATNP